MNSNWIEVFNATNDHHVIVGISKQFQLVFFPTHKGFVYHDFMYRGKVKSACKQTIEVGLVVYKASA